MDNQTIVALAKHFEGLANGIQLAPGVHQVQADLNVSLQGAIKVGQPVPYTPTTAIPLISTLALLLERLGVTRERTKDLLIDVLTQALQNPAPPNEEGHTPADIALREQMKNVDAAIRHVRDITRALPKAKRAGATTAAVAVQVAENALV